MLVDANILLFAIDRSAPQHDRAASWLTDVLNGRRRVGLPWQSIGAFLRIATHPRAARHPLTTSEARAFVDEWFATDVAWVPPATERTAVLLGEVMERHHVTANLVPDAQLVALALEHGLTIVSADSDFARFSEVVWDNPVG